MAASETIEAWVIAWPPGGAIELHDHGGAAGAVVVAVGELVETSTVSQPSGGVALRTTTIGVGGSLRFAGHHVHDIVNLGDMPAISVHVYAPRLTSMTYYRMAEGVLEAGATVRYRVRACEAVTVSVDDLVERARRRIRRVGPHELESLVAEGGLVVDIRPAEQRRQEGAMPGALVVERNVLEWRLDPASDHRLSEVRGFGQPVVVVCSAGFASSLAAASLTDLGYQRAADLIGGYQAWDAWFARHGPQDRTIPIGDESPLRGEPPREDVKGIPQGATA